MERCVAVLGPCDARGAPVARLRDRIAARGLGTLLVDVGGSGEPEAAPDVTVAQVAAAAGARLPLPTDPRRRVELLARGALAVVRERLARGEVHGVAALGAGRTTQVATEVMGQLPFGLPRVMVSSVAGMPAYAGRYFGTSDIVMFHTVVEVAGANPFLDSVLERAAAAVAAMAAEAAAPRPSRARTRPRVALTTFEFSEACANAAARWLEAAGVEVVSFHAQGVGDRAMEAFLVEGWFDGVLDLVPAGVSEELLGGNRAAGAARLTGAARAGVPQVVTPCGFEMISCGPLERGDGPDPLWQGRGLSRRRLAIVDPLRVEARTSAEELRLVAEAVAERLNAATAPVSFLFPAGGWSSLSEPGGPLWDAAADRAFEERFAARLGPAVRVERVDAALNSPPVARRAARELLRLLGIA
ncbi:MAG: Tm-1-like ATP-binding domain-containing protein, partial [Deferrisomatales bacterium]